MRGTRFQKSIAGISGVTFATIPSGVTIDANGINNISVAELAKLDGIASYGYPVGYNTSVSGCSVSGGSVAWAGTTLEITHGMTNLLGFSWAHYLPGGGVSVNQLHLAFPYTNSSVVSACLSSMNQIGFSITAASGGTLYWMAFGK